jgi:hypothetical protein
MRSFGARLGLDEPPGDPLSIRFPLAPRSLSEGLQRSPQVQGHRRGGEGAFLGLLGADGSDPTASKQGLVVERAEGPALAALGAQSALRALAALGCFTLVRQVGG